MDAELRERWNRMFVQAEEFEAVDKADEARARAGLALAEIRARHSRAVDAKEAAELQKFLRRAERYVEHYEALHAKWQERILERERQFMKREDEAYHAPLPVPPHTGRG